MNESKNQFPEFNRLVDVIKKLRDPQEGCPWDLKQTHHSLLKYLLEESYEFVHAVENKPEDMEEELGDILLQVLLHAQIASEKKDFDIESVSKVLAQKMIRRHPHVFNKNSNNQPNELTDEELQRNWDKIKKEEKETQLSEDLLPHHSFHGPSLLVSTKIGKKTKSYKFDWDNYQDVAKKVQEEWDEVQVELDFLAKHQNNHEKVYEEIGDLLFSVAQLARHLNIDPEEALRDSNRKFLKRFNLMNQMITKNQQSINNLNQDQLESYWVQVKRQLKENSKKEK